MAYYKDTDTVNPLLISNILYSVIVYEEAHTDLARSPAAATAVTDRVESQKTGQPAPRQEVGSANVGRPCFYVTLCDRL